MDNLRDFVNKVSILQSQYAELYDESGLVSINPSYIQVRVSVIAELVMEYSLPYTLEQISELTEDYPWEVSMEIDGLEFCAVGTTKKMIAAGFMKELEK